MRAEGDSAFALSSQVEIPIACVLICDLMERTLSALLFCACLIGTGCGPAAPPDDRPQWIRKLIAQSQKEPVGNPPQSVWQYVYKGRKVYYVPPQCCDQYSRLLDENGTPLCAPDGGMTGDGDGKCPDFYDERSQEKLIWRDPRKR